MQAKKRYFLLLVVLVTVILCWINLHVPGQDGVKVEDLRRYVETYDFKEDSDSHFSPRKRREVSVRAFKQSRCRMETCFDFSKCKHGFKVYAYPVREKISKSYEKILLSVRESRYYTTDPTEACLFVLAIDTLDRDTLSSAYVKNIRDKIRNLQYWDGGANHILFNLYSGTWPNYKEDLGFDIGRAILAKSSISLDNFRPNFDLSLPLIHKDHPWKGGKNVLVANTVPPARKYTLTFKGKRYLHGIGSETRNTLYHLHNSKDIILLTTCKHGKGWKALMDERCHIDNANYDRYDFKLLLNNSTFCLVPRGRRLGSFRFLETLQAACIPVLLSNGWVLPFSEVIDWNKATIMGDERLLLQIPTIVRSVSNDDILSLRQQTQIIWENYFSSVQKIVETTLEIIKDRITSYASHNSVHWNTPPGALHVLPEYSQDMAAFPFYLPTSGKEPVKKYTAVIHVTNPIVLSSSPMHRLMKSLGKSLYLGKILLLWSSDTPPPSRHKWPVEAHVPITVIQDNVQTISRRFYPYEQIVTDAVLSLTEDVTLTTDEIDFAFSVWLSFPQRIVGFPARSHYWDDPRSRWGYSSKWTNDYSIILTDAAFYHRYYNYLYTKTVNSSLITLLDQGHNCEDILMNFLVSHVTKLPPVKVTQRKLYKDANVPNVTSKRTSHNSIESFATRQKCMNVFAAAFGYMPLVRSKMRLEPMLFKDPVSKKRKRYIQMELVT